MLADGQAGHQALLQTTGRQVVHAGVEELPVRMAGEILVADRQPALLDPEEACTSPKERSLAAPLEAGQPDHLALVNGQREVGRRQVAVAEGHVVEPEDLVTDLHAGTLRLDQDPAEHHLDELVRRARHGRLSDQPPAPHHADSPAQVLDLIELVRDEDDAHPLGGESLSASKSLTR